MQTLQNQDLCCGQDQDQEHLERVIGIRKKKQDMGKGRMETKKKLG